MMEVDRNRMERPAHHRRQGGFRNPWPHAEQHGFRDFLKWVVERRRNARRPDPDPSIFARSAPQFVVPRATPQELTLTWVGHTSFLIQIGGLNVLVDPMWSARASPVQFAGPKRWVPPAVDFDRLPPIDIVVLSHDHYDHLDAGTVSRIVSRYPAVQWFAPLGVGTFLRQRGARDVTERDWWQDATAARGLRVTCVPAQHFSGRTLARRNRTLWCGWTLRSGQHALFFGGDTALHPEFGAIASRCGPFDLAILPIGAYDPRWFMGSVHMDPEDCMKAFSELNAAQAGRSVTLVAAHWGTFKLTDEPMDEPPARMRSAWLANGMDSNRLWIMRHGETRKHG
jgi:N-acyl-phosphatidylethanolamine-hydrolysing phospholipase D